MKSRWFVASIIVHLDSILVKRSRDGFGARVVADRFVHRTTVEDAQDNDGSMNQVGAQRLFLIQLRGQFEREHCAATGTVAVHG